MTIRHMALGGFLVGLSIIFQLIPVFFGEIFVIMTIFSALPIFIIAKINPKAGGIAFVVAAILILSFNSHEGLFFIFTNGPVGLALGILYYHSDMKGLISLAAGFVLTTTLSIMNFMIGIPVFGGAIPGPLSVQLSILLVFSTLYCWFYLYVAVFSFNLLNRRYPLIRKK